jgi:WD40 repeat protein
LAIFNDKFKELKRLPGSDDLIRPEWSPDGRYIFATCYKLGHKIRVWDTKNYKYTDMDIIGFEDEYQFVQMISFSSDFKKAAILTDDFKKIIIADIKEKNFSAIKMVPDGFVYVAESKWINKNEIIFIGKRDPACQELWTININTDEVKRVGIDDLCIMDYFDISPDNNEVVVCANKKINKEPMWRIWKYSLITGKTVRLTDVDGSEPAWKKHK